MSIKIWILNLMLIGAITFSAIKIHDVWVQKNETVVSKTVNQKVNPEADARSVTFKRKTPPEATYKNVVDKNLFSPDRKEYLPEEPPLEEEEPAAEKAAEPEIKPFEGFGRKVTLYGVLIAGEKKMALISNPERKQGASKDIWVRTGDSILEVKQRNEVLSIKVEEILVDRLIVNDGTKNKYEVLLYDKDNPKRREQIKKAATAEVVGTQKRSEAAQREAKTAEAQKRQPTKRKPAKRSAPAKESEASKKSSKPKSQYKVVNTPFGEIKRKVQ
jgi:hypothetical protein